MRTVGVDLAAEAVRTAVARVEWPAGKAVVTGLELKADDARIVETILGADKAGVDCPLGWPDRFVDFISAHRAGHVTVPEGRGRAWRRDLTLRVTDQVVYAETGLTPLSVSADLIGHTAMRCAALLAVLAARGRPVDRSGSGVVVEVYPAASLKRWGLPHRSYKRAAGLTALGTLVDALKAAAPWLDLGVHEALCRASADAADAVIAALAARAAALGLATSPDHDQRGPARTEGWIAVPTASLDELVRD
jgi:predicted nuclease with RNAse H fold